MQLIHKRGFIRLLSIAVTFLFFALNNNVNAAFISGKVIDETGQPLAFSNVFIKGTTNGTTTNMDGDYKIEVTAGTYEIVFRFIGYKTIQKEVIVKEAAVTLNVTLQKENYTLREAVVTAGEDPAYAVIRNAIRKRKFYLEQVEEYSCDVYIKGLQRVKKYPKKFLGKEVQLGQFIDSVSGIVYLSESVSKFNYKKQGQIREEMISSKVSGSNKAFSYNQASDMLFNFYENLMETGLSPRGVVSPIAENALFYYKYRLAGTYFENDMLINKIEVLPRRKNDPVFRGYIYIQENTWRIHALDLVLTKESQILFVDTFAIKQVFVPAAADNSVWLAASNNFYFHFDLFGFEGNGSYIGIFSNYNLQPGFSKKFFSGEIMKVNDDANKKDTGYWSAARPVPLSAEESVDYVRKDSMRTIRESKHYLDSLDHTTNKISVSKVVLTGYNYRQRYKKQEFNFSPLIQNVQFNTVEGLNFSLAPTYTKRYEERKRKLDLIPFLKYGVANKTFNATMRAAYLYNREHFSTIAIEGGKNSFQLNNRIPISPIINTSYSLFGEKNYLKLFSKSYGLISYTTEVTNGVNINVVTAFADRTALVNHTDYAFKNVEGREYTSNNPLNETSDEPAFEKNQSLTAEINFRFRIKQKYISRPDVKIISGSRYPTFVLGYKKGFHNVFNSDVDYDLITAGVNDELNVGLLGSTAYELSAGKFLNNTSLYLMDATHFNGNQTVFSSFDLDKFSLLNYFTYSTAEEFMEAHVQHDFGGFIFNKVPLLRKLKLNELVSFDYLHVKGLPDYFELAAGISKLNLLKLEFVAGFSKNIKTQTAIRISLSGL